MSSFALVSGGDSNFFPLLQEVIRSVRDKPQGKRVPFYVFNAGLTQAQCDLLAQQRVTTVAVPWRHAIDVPGPQRMLAVKCLIPELLPQHGVYVWLDADAWVQDWRAIEVYCRTAEEEQFCAAAVTDRSFEASAVSRFNTNF